MALGTVCALIGGAAARPELVRETREALVAQLPRPEHVLEFGAADRAPGLDASLATGADWIWMVDGVTVPRTDALEAFSTALGALDGLPAPLLLAGKVVDEAGALHPDALPRHELFEKQITVDACERGVVHLRAAPAGSLLIRKEAFERFGRPRTDLPASWAAFEFTARVLQSWDDTGYLIPSSVAVRRVAPRPPGRHGGAVRTRARLLAGPAWTTTEKLWEGFLVVESAVKGVRGPARPA